MNTELLLLVTLALVIAPFWIYTLHRIRRGCFLSRYEKQRWYRTVLHLPLLGLIWYWTKGEARRLF
ncbi:MAG: hypothetical protein LPJ89_04460 [Hymenobacteraceae bacterium]|nr:hypothetical protein [Hymenobacteraceae bacterium]MDX5394883.1 hypothetical protein [Hymenobacteraceae bacterium]MDX5443018.1 hypothetical protein [Hymenobacteraceae bacterium]MDX5510917.1 hypothetical protein [Hymenobacteraceae bacterium]